MHSLWGRQVRRSEGRRFRVRERIGVKWSGTFNPLRKVKCRHDTTSVLLSVTTVVNLNTSGVPRVSGLLNFSDVL